MSHSTHKADELNADGQCAIRYAGPEWAWSTLFATLECDTESSAFDEQLRKEIRRALAAIRET